MGFDIFVIHNSDWKDAADAVKENLSCGQRPWPPTLYGFFFEKYEALYDLASSGGRKRFTNKILDLAGNGSSRRERSLFEGIVEVSWNAN